MSYRSIESSEVPALHPVAQIRDVWPTLAGAGGIASWRHFDPFAYPQVLPWVLLLRQEDPAEPDRLRYAVCGDGCRQTFGFSYQGKWFGDDLPEQAVASRLAEFAAIREGRGPVYSFSPLPISDREFIEVYRGVFGFSSDGSLVDRYLVVLAPDNVRVAGRRPAFTDQAGRSRASSAR